ncbi:hypothetical protein QR685DRAFT_515326 [Neurospora intermedia]|uniref:Uncharacterized protein n=1 Tax=Neurospora intermedia TaxID=5142 RepID=A0ABR3DJT7_NEUIN
MYVCTETQRQVLLTFPFSFSFSFFFLPGVVLSIKSRYLFFPFPFRIPVPGVFRCYYLFQVDSVSLSIYVSASSLFDLPPSSFPLQLTISSIIYHPPSPI